MGREYCILVDYKSLLSISYSSKIIIKKKKITYKLHFWEKNMTQLHLARGNALFTPNTISTTNLLLDAFSKMCSYSRRS